MIRDPKPKILNPNPKQSAPSGRQRQLELVVEVLGFKAQAVRFLITNSRQPAVKVLGVGFRERYLLMATLMLALPQHEPPPPPATSHKLPSRHLQSHSTLLGLGRGLVLHVPFVVPHLDLNTPSQICKW